MHFVAAVLVQVVRGGERAIARSSSSLSHRVCRLAINFAPRSELCLSCCVAQGVRRGKAGLWFYTGVTVVTLVRLLVMRTLANEFGHDPTPRVASAKA